MKRTDYEKVFELAANILKDDKTMIELTNDLGNKLKTLRGTFQDDGFDEIETFVKDLTATLVNSQTAFSVIANELHAYGLKLKAGKA